MAILILCRAWHAEAGGGARNLNEHQQRRIGVSLDGVGQSVDD